MTANTGPTIVGQLKRADTGDTYPLVDANDLLGGLKSAANAAALPSLLNLKPMDLAIDQSTGVIYQYRSGAYVQLPPSSLPLIGSGTVTSVSVTTQNGVSATVTNPTTTPALAFTLGAITPTSVAASGSVTGSNLSGTNSGDVTLGTANGLSLAAQALSLALAGAASTGALSSTDWNTFNGKGTVSSVGLSVPSWLSVAGSPVTGSGTLAVTAAGGQTANLFLATPNGTTGAVGLRAIVAADVPTLNQNTTGNAATATVATAANGLNSATTTIVVNTATAPTSGQVLTATSGTAANWQTPSASLTNPMTTVGDVIVGGTGGSPTRLGLGANGTFLGVSGGVIGYFTPAGGGNVSNVGTPTNGQLAQWTTATTIQGVTTLPTAAVPAFTGDVTNTAGSLATTISTNAVTLGKLAQTGAHTYLGNNTGATANVAAITSTQLTADLNLFTSTLQGLVPGSGGGTTNFLRADGTWAAPAGSGTVTSVALTAPSVFSVGGSPVTTTGTLALTFATGQTANQFLATPNGTTGAVGLRAIVAADIPTLNQNTTGNAATATTATAANGLNSATTTVVVNAATAPTSGQVLTATSGTAANWQTPTNGTVTSVSVTTANGVSGSVATATTTPAITLTLGAITPTSVNGLTITTTTGTLTIASGKTLVGNNSLTLAGTDGTTMTFPSVSATVPGLALNNIFTNVQAVTPYRANITGAVSIDLTATAKSNNLHLTLTGNVTSFALTNPTDGAVYNIRFIQDATGGRTFAGFPSAFKFAGGTAPTFSTAANAVDFMSAEYGSTETTYMASFLKGMA